MHNIDGRGASFSQQSRPLERALPASHDDYPSVVKLVEPYKLAGVRPAVVRKRRRYPFRNDRKSGDAWGGHHRVRDQPLPVVEAGNELPVCDVKARDKRRARLDLLLLAEPVCVIQKGPHGNWRNASGINAALHQECLKRVDAVSIQVPVGAGAQQHPLRHVASPEAHRLAKDEWFDSMSLGIRRRGQPVGSGAYDQQRNVGVTVFGRPAGVAGPFHTSNYGLMDSPGPSRRVDLYYVHARAKHS